MNPDFEKALASEQFKLWLLEFISEHSPEKRPVTPEEVEAFKRTHGL